ncbi:MAG: RNA polymerase sigma factor [Deltaproteobacteria bacterium]|nr:RNA polymerase sigma factor [Nannocystaceae bacterium]
MRRHGDFESAEDVVQEALLAAATQWPVAGVPDHPRAWLVQVAVRRMTDRLRSDEARRRREELVATQSDDATEPERGDDTLLLLFMCCHPALTQPSAIALTLRAVGGLTTAEIARAFLVPEATMAQRISRAKQTIKSSQVPFELPLAERSPARLRAVLHVLYLIFNEGYSSSAGPELRRSELADEAIRLTRATLTVLPEHPEVLGLLALMRLTDARASARVDAVGDLVPLHEQDRSRWDRAAIDDGVALVTRALAKGAAGPYQLQAAIAAVHDEAARAEDTDWPQILALYVVLDRMSDNPMVRLNKAIAAAMVHGPAVGLAQLDALDRDGRLAESHRLDAVRAHLLELAGERAQALACYRRAAERTASLVERRYLAARALRVTDDA